MLQIEFHGGSETVSGNRIEIRWTSDLDKPLRRFLIDCGMFQGPKVQRVKNWAQFENINDFEFILLTHAHVDHSGLLPRFVNQGFTGPIYCSEGTSELCEILLIDAASLQEEDAEFANKTHHSKHRPALPLYTKRDAQNALQRFQVLPTNKETQLNDDITVELRPVGHILGACALRLKVKQPNHEMKIITFSGDLGGSRSLLMKKPQPLLPTDYLIVESTYGNRCHPPLDMNLELAKVVNTVWSNKGSLIIPAFAVGRTQELLLLLTLLEMEGKIPKIPKYLDSPMARKTTAVYRRFLTEFQQHTDNPLIRQALLESLKGDYFIEIESTEESKQVCRNPHPKIVLAASGMLQGGRVLHHLKHSLPDPKNGVLFVGYQAEGTKGSLLKNRIDQIRIHHELVEVRAQIYSIEGFSAHADSQEILNWLRSLNSPPKLTLVNHGERAAAESLAYRIQNELEWPVLSSELNTTYPES